MDRYIVSSINKEGTTNQQIIQASPRILLAIMIGIVISRPLELKIFDKEIRQKLKTAYLKGQHRKIDTLQRTYNEKYAMELNKNTDLKKEKDSLEKDINRSRYLLNQEEFGDKTNQTSGIVGYGTYAKQKKAILEEKGVPPENSYRQPGSARRLPGSAQGFRGLKRHAHVQCP